MVPVAVGHFLAYVAVDLVETGNLGHCLEQGVVEFDYFHGTAPVVADVAVVGVRRGFGGKFRLHLMLEKSRVGESESVDALLLVADDEGIVVGGLSLFQQRP